MLKLEGVYKTMMIRAQPPSGGCVLKLQKGIFADISIAPAAFRRLCVETLCGKPGIISEFPAAFRRLCVETYFCPAAQIVFGPSRLQAAVC